MKLRFFSSMAIFVLAQQLLQAQFKAVPISRGSQGSELSIAINPYHPIEVVAGSNAGLYYSADSGVTWRKSDLSCRRSSDYNNPVALWHSNRSMAYSYNKGSDTCIFETVFCRYFTARPGKSIERRSMYLDPQLGVMHATWTEIGEKNKTRKKDTSFIYYSQLRENTKNWSTPERINSYTGDGANNDSTLMGAVCTTGSNYEIYTAWAGPLGLMFRNLTVAPGKNLEAEKIIAPIKNGWQYTVGENINSNGLPTMVCDASNGEHKGRIYICWSDEKHGTHNKNVFLTYSDNQGENWAEPVVVTYRPNHKEQFMPYMTIDQSTGYLYILYYDQQNFVDGELTDLYLAKSKNGGLKFDYYKVNVNAFKPYGASFIENYLGLSVVNNVIRPIWTQPDEKNNSAVYTALIDENSLLMYDKNYSEDIEIQKTFAWSDKIKIDFNLKNNSELSAAITKPLEPGFEKIAVKNKKLLKGKNTLLIDTKAIGLQKGNYTLTLYYNHKNTSVWITEE